VSKTETTGTEAEQLDALAKEHGELHIYRTPHGVLALKAPSPGDFQRFTDKLTGDKGSKYATMREIVLACRAYPDREAALELVKRYPGLVLQAGTAINELAGTEFEAEVKKG